MNRVQAQGQSIESLQKEVSFLKTELTGFYDLIQDLITKVPAMRAPAQAPSGDLASLRGEFDSLKRHTSDQMKVMKQSLNGQGPVTIGSWRFDSAEDCAAQLTAWGVTTSIWEYLFDPSHILASLLHRSRTHKEVSDQAVLTMKTTLTASQLTAMSAFETTVPEIFSGLTGTSTPGVETSRLTTLFGAIKTFDLFDSGDGETGVLNYIRVNLRDFLPQQHQEAEALFGATHPGLLAFLDLLRDRSSTALEALLKECVELYRNLLTRERSVLSCTAIF